MLGAAAFFVLLAALVPLGYGGLGPLFERPAVIAHLGLLLVGGLAVASRPLGGAGRGGSPAQRIVFFGTLALLAALHFVLPRLELAGLGLLGGTAAAWTGIGLSAAGWGVRLAAMQALGRLFSYHLTVQPGHALVRAGPYRWIRHPAYLGFLLTLAGFGLAFRSVAGLALPAVYLPVVLWTIAREEAVLARSFGESFEDYRRATRRLVPYLF